MIYILIDPNRFTSNPNHKKKNQRGKNNHIPLICIVALIKLV